MIPTVLHAAEGATKRLSRPTRATPQNVKEQYRNASICANNRVVFNITGNKYRLVVEMQYRAGIAWVKFVGMHTRYDMIDVETVNEYLADSKRRRFTDCIHTP